MQRHFLIVENDSQRLRAFDDAIPTALPKVEIVTYTNAADAIQWLSRHHTDVAFISLNFDLGTAEELADPEHDVGNGNDVAAWLASRKQLCPILLHTDNPFTRPTMQATLTAGGWNHNYVAPGNGTDWVRREWLPKVLSLLETAES
jgi:hypothetical protein